MAGSNKTILKLFQQKPFAAAGDLLEFTPEQIAAGLSVLGKEKPLKEQFNSIWQEQDRRVLWLWMQAYYTIQQGMGGAAFQIKEGEDGKKLFYDSLVKMIKRFAPGIDLSTYATQDWASSQIDAKVSPAKWVKRALTENDNLNNIIDPGHYWNPANAAATPARNYPTQYAGSLEVLMSAGITQRYTAFKTGETRCWTRNYHGSGWSPWREVAQVEWCNSQGWLKAASLNGYATQSWASSQIDTKVLPAKWVKRALTENDNLNNIIDPGHYWNPANATATPARNYPTQYAGSLEVLMSGGITQRYTAFKTGKTRCWTRNYHGSGWSPWREVAQVEWCNSQGWLKAASLNGYATQSWASSQIDTKVLPAKWVKRALTENDNLNNIIDPGHYWNPANATATPARNYPTQYAGSLEVLMSGGITQRYTAFKTGKTRCWTRNYHGGGWSPWREVAQVEWCNSQGWLKAASLNGYATQSWANTQGWIKTARINEMFIGVPLPYMNTSFPLGFIKMDGRVIDKKLFPVLAAQYGANLPDLNDGSFIRGIGGSAAAVLGRQGDALQNITGSFGWWQGVETPRAGGVFNLTGKWSDNNRHGGLGMKGDVTFDFNASRVVRTSGETRPKNIAFIYICLAG